MLTILSWKREIFILVRILEFISTIDQYFLFRFTCIDMKILYKIFNC